MLGLRKRQELFRDDNELTAEAGSGLDLSAFIGTANLFFTGLVILNLHDLPVIVRLPVVYLVVSAVAFIFTAVLYANVYGTQDSFVSRAKIIQSGNWIAEYLGIYLFVISIPLLILGVTDDLAIQYTTAIACYGGLILYSASPFSIDHRRYHGGLDRTLNTIFLLLFTFGVYIIALTLPQYVFTTGMVGLVILVFFSYFTFSTDSSITQPGATLPPDAPGS